MPVFSFEDGDLGIQDEGVVGQSSTTTIVEEHVENGIAFEDIAATTPRAPANLEAHIEPFPRSRIAHTGSTPIRMPSPSPHRLAASVTPRAHDDQLDFQKVRNKAARRKAKKRDKRLVPSATHMVRGFNTPGTSTPGASCGEESDVSMSGANTPVLGPFTKLSSVASSPAMRPSTPSGISNLKLQLDQLSLSRPAMPRSISMQRTNTNGSQTTQSSDSDATEMYAYEVPLDEDFSLDDQRKQEELESSRRPTMARKMTADDFEPLTCLGKGSFGTVLLVKHRETGRLFAQKQLKKASIVVRKKLVEQTKTERNILESVNRHPFVVKLFYAFQDHEKLYLILEYAQGGELFHHLSLERMFPEETAAFYMAEMVLALEHLHRTVGVVYRDIKPENCLLDSEGHLLLTDFGLSKVAADDADRCSSFLGTVEYMAPEIIQGKAYGMAVDWWSLGALGHDLMTGSPPFTGNNHAKIQQKILSGKLQLPYYLGPDAKDLLTRLLRKDPRKRLGGNMPKDLATIKGHRFFKHIDWKALARRELVPPIMPLITDPELAENFSSEFTDLAMSPRASRHEFPGEMRGGAGAGAGAGESETDGEEMEWSKDPFGGFSFVASSSLLDRDW